MSCCLPLQPEQIPKKLSIIIVSLPRECGKSPPSCFSTQNMPSLPVTSSFNLIPFLPLLGAWLGPAGHLFSSIWSWFLFLWNSIHFFPHVGPPSVFQRPPTLTSMGGNHVNQYANRNACVPLTQLSSPCAMCRLHNHRTDTVTLYGVCILPNTYYWNMCKILQVHYSIYPSRR